MVDVAREGFARKKQIRRVIYVALVCTLLAGMTWALSRMKPAAPNVERTSVWVGEAERGPMVIEVWGTGTLVPEEVRRVAAATDGRVERIRVLPGFRGTTISGTGWIRRDSHQKSVGVLVLT